jgi:hypothetical protein
MIGFFDIVAKHKRFGKLYTLQYAPTGYNETQAIAIWKTLNPKVCTYHLSTHKLHMFKLRT